MKTLVHNESANITIEELPSGKRKIFVELLNSDLFMPIKTCETNYPIDLIDKILMLKGPAYLCDEILREESPYYVQRNLEYDLLAFVEEKEFKNRRILDFGCGSGTSTMILARMFPKSEIVGVDMQEGHLVVAHHRRQYYKYKNITFMFSPKSDQLPLDVGFFDYAILSAVYEHLLPEERKILLPQIWSLINPGGVLFLSQTPYRYFPIETHTTSGLPLVNYLPKGAAHVYAQRFSKRKLRNSSWNDLLRKGIRGGSISEILKILNCCPEEPVMLNPYRLGIEDNVDLWYFSAGRRRKGKYRTVFHLAKLLKLLTGLIVIPYLSLAIKKAINSGKREQ